MPTYRNRRYRRARFGPLTGRDLALAIAAGAALAWFAGNVHGTGSGPASAGVSAPAAGSARMSPAAANVALGKQLAAARGWGSGIEWTCLDELWTRESGWQNTIVNRSSGAFGIAQALGHGGGAATVPVARYPDGGRAYGLRVDEYPDAAANGGDPGSQIRWGLAYIAATYGTPCGAWAHETANSWY